MKKFLFTAAFSVSLFTIGLYGQEKKSTIGGKIISFEESFPLEGVSVVVKGTKNLTGTQSDGTFNLGITPDDKILVVSLEGYETQEVKLGKTRDYSIVLKRAAQIQYFQALERTHPLLSDEWISLN